MSNPLKSSYAERAKAANSSNLNTVWSVRNQHTQPNDGHHHHHHHHGLNGIPSQQLPPIHDTDNWPEVGKSTSVTTSLPTTSPVVDAHSGVNGITASTSSKSEKYKSKWVPIPPEELQAAADALQSSRIKKHARHRGDPHRQSGNNSIVQSTSHSSVAPSTSHSVIPSATHSRTHSRVHSRSGSAHSGQNTNNNSSPRYSGRRTFPDDVAAGGSASRSSRPPSPIPVVFPPPIAGHDIDVRNGNLPGSTYYVPSPHLPLSLTRQSSSSSVHAALLPLSPLTALHNTPAFPTSTAHSHLPPQTYAQVYPQYASYEYAQVQPYPSYWNGLAGSPVHPTGPHQLVPGIGRVDGLKGPDAPGVPDTPVDVPPPTMIARPPPPGESDAVNGYRAVGAVRQVVFGSLGEGGDVGDSEGAQAETQDSIPNVRHEEEDSTKGTTVTSYSIGVAPGEPGPSGLRSRTRSHKAKGTTETEHESTEQQATEKEAGVRVIDLTDLDSKWEFGNTEADEDAEAQSLTVAASPPLPLMRPAHQSLLPFMTTTTGLPMPLTAPLPVVRPITITMPPIIGGLGRGLGADVGKGDEWEVKDYGYGFGQSAAERDAREKERAESERLEGERLEGERLAAEREREREKEEADREREREREREQEIIGRTRRGTYPGSYERATGYDHGAYRRGRGSFGRGYNNSARVFPRGTFQSQQQRAPPFTITPPPHFQPLPAHSVDPSNGYYSTPPLPLTTYIPTGYESYQPGPPSLPPAPASAPNAPPVPVPLSTLSFPLDPTRWYLLGQLEYYLSPQNMAQDFFLRQRMDSRGWIQIPLIASFKRVLLLTADVQLVRDVLSLSSVVEVRDGWVRMIEWKQFVLPNAARSVVEGDSEDEEYEEHHHANGELAEEKTDNPVNESHGDGGYSEADEGECEAEEEEEEEEVVFVMERDEGPWPPERRQG